MNNKIYYQLAHGVGRILPDRLVRQLLKRGDLADAFSYAPVDELHKELGFGDQVVLDINILGRFVLGCALKAHRVYCCIDWRLGGKKERGGKGYLPVILQEAKFL